MMTRGKLTLALGLLVTLTGCSARSVVVLKLSSASGRLEGVDATVVARKAMTTEEIRRTTLEEVNIPPMNESPLERGIYLDAEGIVDVEVQVASPSGCLVGRGTANGVKRGEQDSYVEIAIVLQPSNCAGSDAGADMSIDRGVSDGNPTDGSSTDGRDGGGGDSGSDARPDSGTGGMGGTGGTAGTGGTGGTAGTGGTGGTGGCATVCPRGASCVDGVCVCGQSDADACLVDNIRRCGGYIVKNSCGQEVSCKGCATRLSCCEKLQCVRCDIIIGPLDPILTTTNPLN